MEWDLRVWYDNKAYTLKAVKEYESAQIMRIRVKGNYSSLLLETNFPVAVLSKGKAITWKIREGKLAGDPKKDAALLIDIMQELEHILKGKDNASEQQGRIDYIRNKKSW